MSQGNEKKEGLAGSPELFRRRRKNRGAACDTPTANKKCTVPGNAARLGDILGGNIPRRISKPRQYFRCRRQCRSRSRIRQKVTLVLEEGRNVNSNDSNDRSKKGLEMGPFHLIAKIRICEMAIV